MTNPNVACMVGEYVQFFCPGCKEVHTVKVRGSNAWSWNDSLIQPTFSQSVLVTSGHYLDSLKPQETCWCTYNANNPGGNVGFECNHCHSHITNGVITFLDDTTHELSGQAVPLPAFEHGELE
jgi:hypothetical protein